MRESIARSPVDCFVFEQTFVRRLEQMASLHFLFLVYLEGTALSVSGNNGMTVVQNPGCWTPHQADVAGRHV